MPDYTVRNYRINLDKGRNPSLSKDVFLNLLFDTASSALPDMEGFVIFVIKKAIPLIKDPNLKKLCHTFIEQEKSHSREHIIYNKYISESTADSAIIVSNLKSKIKKIKQRWSLHSLLAAGVCFEHITAATSIIVIKNSLLNGTHPELKRFWYWHMLEELEHKNVLYDVYKHLNGGRLRLSAIYLVVAANYLKYATQHYLALMKPSAGLLKSLRYLFGSQSPLSRALLITLLTAIKGRGPHSLKIEHGIITQLTSLTKNQLPN